MRNGCLLTAAVLFICSCTTEFKTISRDDGGDEEAADLRTDASDPDGEDVSAEEEAPSACGNGRVDEGEDCDDGRNDDPDDGCRPDCTYSCKVEADCDDANPCTSDSCSAIYHWCVREPAGGGSVCRTASGTCDVEETCTGTSAECPADTFKPSDTLCRHSFGDCDPAESCTGTAAACPSDALDGNDTECRPSAGVCDPEEHCTGSSVVCPVDTLMPTTLVCRAAGGACDPGELCTGTSAACPSDTILASAAICRASGGVCDVEEHCTGSAAACPSDAKVGTATTCRASGGICDTAESCDGTSAACPADVLKTSAQECRPSEGACDVAERCTGTSPLCPANAYNCPAGYTCNGARTGCAKPVVTTGFVPINAGVYTMGSPTDEPGRLADETQHTVSLRINIEMMAREVTQGGFSALIGRNPSYFTSCGTNCPVEQVSWHEALDYANRLSTAEGVPQCFDCTDSGTPGVTCQLKTAFAKPQDCPGFRLPTEAEWEYAARAGTTTAFWIGTITNTGCSPLDSNLDAIGWYCGNAGSTTHPAGAKQENRWGLFDMNGNVYEWVWDWYGTYPASVSDYHGPSTGSSRGFRGGSWYDGADYCRSALRWGTTPGDRHWRLGFRLVRSAPRSAGFVPVTPGTFTMGSPTSEPGRGADETQHGVTLTLGYEMMAREVTQLEFATLTGYNPSNFAACGPHCPVEKVSWHEALKYANLMSARDGLPECFDCTGTAPNFTCSLKTAYARPQDCRGYRLPTEAEWEYAARAGTTTAFYSGGITYTDCTLDTNLNAIGWYCGNASSTTHPAGGKQSNAWGFYDMSGNVFEWVWDWYGAYPASAVVDPIGPSTASDKMHRGGGLFDRAAQCRSAFRDHQNPYSWRYPNLGFRLVRSTF